MAMTRKQRRGALIAAAGSVLALAVGLVLYALSGEITLYRTPTELAEQQVSADRRLRVGGLVEQGTLWRGKNAEVRFDITDTAHSLHVSYRGLLPDLFREGQGVVAEGRLVSPGNFLADTVLAKHDERYMPKEVADALKAQGVWEEDGANASSPAATASAR